MDRQLPSIVRTVFTIHLVVAIVVGLGLLLVPTAIGALWGYPAAPGVEPVLRGFGAMILGFGGLTSFYGRQAKNWEQVDYIVRGEITFLALAVLVYLLSLVMGNGPVLGNVLNLVVDAVLLGLFIVAWQARPRAVTAAAAGMARR